MVGQLFSKFSSYFPAPLGSTLISLNFPALAAYFWLNEDYDNAAVEYRMAKRMCTETEEDITVDTLQKLHILVNLGQLLADV